MIERLNFYDLYGYLLPGAAVTAILLLPFLLTGSVLPALEWSSALASLGLAYIAGHLLQIIARKAIGEGDQPSDLLLTADERLPEEFRLELVRLLRQDFGLDVTVKSQRKVAFEACRYAIQSKDLPSYAEQFQGLYALQRGVAIACLTGSLNYMGWIMSASAREEPQIALLMPFLAGLFLWTARTPWPVWGGVFTAVLTGVIAAEGRVNAFETVLVLLGMALGFAAAAALFYEAHGYFRWSFARAVFMAYYARRKSPLMRPDAKSSQA